MKTSIKLLASALLVSFMTSVSSPVRADDHKSQNKVFAAVMFPAAKNTKLWLCLEKYKSENKIDLTLVNQRGDILFHETVSGKNSKQMAYRQQFDMSELSDGTYTFRISAGSQTEERSFKLTTPAVEEVQPSRLIAIK
ncbi:hypothetical protein [Spirosoma linguale]|uniref:Secretion system C-terminal sorting domain-containing protein n=1 Tax=Spirosoma linguale (strain ATCC 33905 / DSM 74 / LMG 10896 / Claus 1) TaxID=504472 RepID=D2QR87_SPILD|nr:hypothetical protein Slin_3634 [Spirosoma linguale DSM 74]